MALYKLQFFDKNGKLKSTSVQEYPTDVGRWKQNKKLDKKDGFIGSYRSEPTKRGVNRKVVSYESVSIKDGSKLKATLIENKLKTKRKNATSHKK